MNGGGLSIVYWRPSGLAVTSSHAESAAERGNHAERGKKSTTIVLDAGIVR